MRKYWPILFVLLALLVTCQPARGVTRPRLLVLGDSLSVGLYATSEQNGFKHVLADLLEADLASCRGSNLQHVVTCWEQYQAWQPEIVVIEIGLNDVSNFNGLAMSEADWIATYDDFVADIKATGAQVVVTTLFHGRPSHHSLYTTYERYNDHIATIAANRGVILADVWTATKTCPNCISQPGIISPWSPGWQGDSFHPSDAGHRLIAETIFAAMPQPIYLPAVLSDSISGYPAP